MITGEQWVMTAAKTESPRRKLNDKMTKGVAYSDPTAESVIEMLDQVQWESLPNVDWPF